MKKTFFLAGIASFSAFPVYKCPTGFDKADAARYNKADAARLNKSNAAQPAQAQPTTTQATQPATQSQQLQQWNKRNMATQQLIPYFQNTHWFRCQTR